MKVRELIQKLSSLDQEAEVVLPVYDRDGYEENYTLEIAAYDPAGTGDVVLHWSDAQWLCKQPEKPRVLSETEKKIQEISDIAYTALAKACITHSTPSQKIYSVDWADFKYEVK